MPSGILPHKQLRPRFSVVKMLGKGTFGKVFLALDENSNCLVAIKRYPKWTDSMSREVNMLETCNECPNIIKMRDIFFTKTPKGHIVQNIVQQVMPHSLHTLINGKWKSKSRIPAKTINQIAHQLCEALAYLHSRGLAHRDLKPDNILIQDHGDDNVEVALCDLGASKKLKPGETNMTYVTSRYFRVKDAPELLFGSPDYTSQIDMWSYGCVLAEMILLQTLFPGKSKLNKPFLHDAEQIISIMEILGSPDRSLLDHIKSHASHGTDYSFAMEIMSGVKIDPIPFDKLFKELLPPQVYDSKLVSLIALLLRWDPNDRLTVGKYVHKCTQIYNRVSGARSPKT